MEIFEITLLSIVLVLFLFIIFYTIYMVLEDQLHRKYQAVYHLYNPKYDLLSSYHATENCPKGCNKNKECPHGNYCYHCKGPNPLCCCYDFQCKKCKTE